MEENNKGLRFYRIICRSSATLLFATFIFAWFHLAIAQQPAKVPRIGYIAPTGPENTNYAAFLRGLRDLGYIEGKNILVEYRSMEGNRDRIPSLMAELVQLQVDILVSPNAPTILAAKQATRTIAIVMVVNTDPVASGLVDSLAHPGGNITGITRLTRDLSGKRLEVLKEVVPGISRVGVLEDADAPVQSKAFKDYEAAAHALKIQLQSLEVRGPNPDFEGAFRAAVKGRVRALIATQTTVLVPYPKKIADLAIKHRLPLMFESSRTVEAGGLLSYSSNEPENFKRAAYYVDRILKGAKPAELPVEQPTKFEFVINLKTAKTLGLTIPPDVLARANKIIR
jgi:putative tryptophan/tyrosine transport system substrate-binding protein